MRPLLLRAIARRFVLVLTLGWVVSGIAGPVIDTVFFPYTHGWLGADAAYSIPLDQTSTVWLFGDTFTGERREPRTMIHNSVAIRHCVARTCEVTYWWSGMHTGRADSFFRTPVSNYYWPLDGLVYRQKLYVVLEQMHETGKGGAFGFDYSEIVLATIPNFTEVPEHWKISYQTISTGNLVVPGIALSLKPGPLNDTYAYIFTLFRGSSLQPFAGLMRLPLGDLELADRSSQWHYLAKGTKWRSWQRSTSPADALKLLDGNITEMTVAFHPIRRQWLAVYPTPGVLSRTASFSVAGDLLGPWTAARAFFSYP
ncbi:MAG: DUF4185 domain-containing protein, partial [Bryobacteraceae bacterium]